MLRICTPCYGGLVSARYLQSVIQMKDVMHHAGVPVDVYTHSNESLITRARNTMANDFLRSPEFSHLLFIDADLGFPPDAPLRFMRLGKDVVCGIYAVKHVNLDRLRSLGTELPLEAAEAASLSYAVKVKAGAKVDADGLVEVDYGATGFMMISRQALTKMAEAYPELRYDYAYTNDEAEDNVALFDTFIDKDSGEYLPEDYAFCRRFTAIGGTIHADVFSSFTHVGSYEYSGSFAAYLARLGQG